MYSLREVYSDLGWTDPCTLEGHTTAEGVLEELRLMLLDCKRPVFQLRSERPRILGRVFQELP
jgi:hypothetical protein